MRYKLRQPVMADGVVSVYLGSLKHTDRPDKLILRLDFNKETIKDLSPGGIATTNKRCKRLYKDYRILNDYCYSFRRVEQVYSDDLQPLSPEAMKCLEDIDLLDEEGLVRYKLIEKQALEANNKKMHSVVDEIIYKLLNSKSDKVRDDCIKRAMKLPQEWFDRLLSDLRGCRNSLYSDAVRLPLDVAADLDTLRAFETA